MKKLFKIFLVFLIAINFVFANQVKIKAYEDLPWWYNKVWTTKGDYENDWMTHSGSQAMGLSLNEGSAIYKYRVFILFDNLMPGAKINLSTAFHVTGMRPTVTTWRYQLRSLNEKEGVYEWHTIHAPGDYASNETYNTDYDEWTWDYSIDNFEYVNNTDKIYHGLAIEFEYDEQQNLLYSMMKMENLVVSINPTQEQIMQDTNEKVGGIFETVKNIFTGITNLPSNIANSVKGFFDNIVSAVNKIQTWLSNLLDGIIQGLKSLFIPSDDYFKNYFDSLYKFFNDKLGILILPFDILISLLEKFSNLSSGDGIIHIPNVVFMNETLIPKYEYNLKADVTELMGEYYDLYYMITDVIIYSLLLNLARKKFEEVVGGSHDS